ncbi:MAG TPA: hypothetical protein VF297_07600 [Pyrinomonadaceae bacterium]
MSTTLTIPDNLLQKRSIGNRKILYFNGREAYLAGIYPGIADLDGVNGDTSSIAAGNVDYRAKMEFLAKNGNNFFRQWVIFYPLFADPRRFTDPTKPCVETSESVTSAQQPWRQRYSPFFYNTNLKKWNLSRYNDEFFLKLKLMIKTAADYGIVVQLTIFDRCGHDFVGGDKCLRWPYSPWNARNNVNNLIRTTGETGVNEFYERNIAAGGTTLGALQDAYVNKLVTSTMEYPNVVYEIMNEPVHKADSDVTVEQQRSRRVKWADAIVGAIHTHTQGKRFIFYNDHTGLSDWRARGQDVIYWARSNSGTSNFAKLDGVIFHGDVKEVDPEALEWTFAKNLIVQVSTDTFGGQGKEYHRLTTANAFAKHMMFQAEAIPVELPDNKNAAAGIGGASPAPTLFKLPPFVATWVKIGETSPATGFPHLSYTQNADASMVVMNPDTDRLTQKGRVIQLYANKIAFWNETLQRVGVQEFTFTNNAQNLTLKRADGGTQTFKKYVGPLQPFLYQWERISDTAPAPPAPFYVFFYPDGTLRTRLVSNFEVNNHARVTLVTTQPQQIHIHSDTFNSDAVWNYSFTSDGQRLTLAKAVTDPAQAVTRVYQRVV